LKGKERSLSVIHWVWAIAVYLCELKEIIFFAKSVYISPAGEKYRSLKVGE
jgi:hypothetical protein